MKLSWKAFLVFAAVFLSGMVAGGALGVRWSHRAHPPRGQQRPPSIEQFGRNQMNMIMQRLSLSEEQRQQISPLFNKANEELRQLRASGFKQTTEILTRLDADLVKFLTPDQIRKYEEIRRHQREGMRRFMQSSPPRGEKRPPSPRREPNGPPPEGKEGPRELPPPEHS